MEKKSKQNLYPEKVTWSTRTPLIIIVSLVLLFVAFAMYCYIYRNTG